MPDTVDFEYLFHQNNVNKYVSLILLIADFKNIAQNINFFLARSVVLPIY